ncbi:hypothetical protein ACP_1590 [Acidobacterium capsulatum ATCC 51196]|uniref:Uncharacterized protein n=1 Tax=Acidobacterium capsulatum (strain ATCC 51196 / DSM 11244 / BCRC 80197 / JCM 7670 / NBRC 15755 / NCIMB 13165 / 161) TaxID=240015 RepID=C1F6T2_ACIC5|nr:hypothetical protein ACP_1590 [Acidobacterium capsulatum ATCC 51196]
MAYMHLEVTNEQNREIDSQKICEVRSEVILH